MPTIGAKVRVVVTGATGFVGAALIKRLRRDGCYSVIACVRRRSDKLSADVRQIPVGDIGWNTDWSLPRSAVDVVIHTAARAHVLNEMQKDPMPEFLRVNVGGTRSLAQQAIAAGVRRFVFISSVGVFGNQTFGKPFTAADLPNPQENYALSKLQAEMTLRKCFEGTAVELVIIRPPLVYGPNAPGNFRRLIKLINKGLPLPFGAIHNKRSFVGLDNLIDLIVACVRHAAAANQVFLAGDGEDLSTTELIARMAIALGRPARLIPLPLWMLTAATSLLGGRELSRRLCGSLQVDISKNRELLTWVPPVSVDEGLRATARHFLNESARH